jgi:hypothetical protein
LEKGCFHIALLFFTKRREGDELNKKERGRGQSEESEFR